MELLLEQGGCGLDGSMFGKKKQGVKKKKKIQEAAIDTAPQSMTKSPEENLWLLVRYLGLFGVVRVRCDAEREEIAPVLCRERHVLAALVRLAPALLSTTLRARQCRTLS